MSASSLRFMGEGGIRKKGRKNKKKCNQLPIILSSGNFKRSSADLGAKIVTFRKVEEGRC